MHELRHVFVMTYGRSGSTLLMGILNSIPGWLLRGENRHAMRHLYDFHRSGLAERARVDPARASQPTHPWFGIEAFPEAASLQHIRSLAEATLLRPQHDTRVTGYKEIRWYDEDLSEYVEFLRQVFPGARFVVNTRNLEDVAASNYWTHKDDPLAQVRAIEDKILATVAGLGDAAYRVHYDDYVADPEVLRGLFEPGTVLNHDISADLIRALGHDPQERLEVGGSDVVLATGDVFVSDPAVRDALAERAHLVDMEGYAVAYAAREAGVPVRLVKHVSDTADESALDWASMVEVSALALGEWLRDQV